MSEKCPTCGGPAIEMSPCTCSNHKCPGSLYRSTAAERIAELEADVDPVLRAAAIWKFARQNFKTMSEEDFIEKFNKDECAEITRQLFKAEADLIKALYNCQRAKELDGQDN